MISNAGGSLRIFGLAAGLAAATMSCAAEDRMPNDTVANGESTVNDDEDTADAVTYAGPDSISITDPGESSTSFTTTQPDPTDADAVTYAGPDESDSTVTSSDSGPDTETSTGTDTTSTGTDATSTGSSGTGDTDTNG